MTKQQKLQEIEQQIRKDIPRLMKPTRGCLVTHNNEVLNILKSTDTFYKIEDIKYGTSDILSKEEFNKYFQIIGHEIMLNDWFEWLLNINPDLYYFAIEGNALAFYEDTEHIKDVLINLSKPYLKDQSEELINFLYNLINKQK